MFIETERTPNPATMKFLPGRVVMESGTRDFASLEEASSAPLAFALLSLDHVSGVFFGRDFVSVSIRDESLWQEAKPEILSSLLDHFSSNRPLFDHEASLSEKMRTPSPNTEDSDVIDQIIDLIDTRVRPAVAQDGGDIVFRGFQDGTVYLAMQGACSGCPSSTATLKQGVESLLKYYVPEVKQVLAVPS